MIGAGVERNAHKRKRWGEWEAIQIFSVNWLKIRFEKAAELMKTYNRFQSHKLFIESTYAMKWNALSLNRLLLVYCSNNWKSNQTNEICISGWMIRHIHNTHTHTPCVKRWMLWFIIQLHYVWLDIINCGHNFQSTLTLSNRIILSAARAPLNRCNSNFTLKCSFNSLNQINSGVQVHKFNSNVYLKCSSTLSLSPFSQSICLFLHKH